MAGQNNMNGAEASISPEKATKKSKDSKKQNIKRDFVDITTLIRSIQIAEGNKDCFKRAKHHCEQLDCCWRIYCIGSSRHSVNEDLT